MLQGCEKNEVRKFQKTIEWHGWKHGKRELRDGVKATRWHSPVGWTGHPMGGDDFDDLDELSPI